MTVADVMSAAMSLFGVTFDGKRDMARVLGYRETLDYDLYRARYNRDDIAGRIVDIPAEATWGALPRLTVEADGSESGISRKFDEHAKRLHLRAVMEKADKLAGIGRYSVVLIGFQDGRRLEDPVGEGGAKSVAFLAPFSERNATPADLDLNPASPGFGGPSHFQIDFARGLTEQTSDPLLAPLFSNWKRGGVKAQKVHVSRLLHVAEGTLEDHVYGRPRLRRVWNRLDDLAKAVGGSAEVFWQVADRGMQIDIDPEVAFGDAEKEQLREQIEEYQHGKSRVFRTRGVSIKGLNELGAGNVNPSQVVRAVASLIVGTTGIPYRELFGTERGQNVAAGDRREWLEKVAVRRGTFATEVMLEPYVAKVVHAGALPSVALDAEFFWPPVHDNMHQAEIADIVARGNLNVAKAVQMGASAISPREWRQKYLGLPPEKPADEDEEAAMAEARRREAERGRTDDDRREGMNGAAH